MLSLGLRAKHFRDSNYSIIKSGDLETWDTCYKILGKTAKKKKKFVPPVTTMRNQGYSTESAGKRLTD